MSSSDTRRKPFARSKLETREEEALLLAVATADGPMGARAALRALGSAGSALSESTVTRILRRLDQRGLTRSVGMKGRVLTEEGRTLASLLESDRRRNEEFAQALDIKNINDLLDILKARRGLEREAARFAAQRATADELARLRELAQAHGQQISTDRLPAKGGLEFHRLIGQASHNKVLMAVTATVLAEETDALEQILDLVTKTHGTFHRSPPEHLALVERLEARDADGAESVMVSHLDRLLEETNEFAAEDRTALFGRLLAFVRAAQNGHAEMPKLSETNERRD